MILSLKRYPLIAVIPMFGLMCLACADILYGQYVVTSLGVGQGREIVILADNMYDNGRGFYYQVKVNNQVVVPMSYICAGRDSGSLKFRTLIGKNGNLVGLFEERRPGSILAIHDFSSGETWPRPHYDEPPENRWKIGELLLQELQSEYPDRRLEIGEDVCRE